MAEYQPKHIGENIVNKIHHKYWRTFVSYACNLNTYNLFNSVSISECNVEWSNVKE
jgi:hypothetical protein